MARRHIAQALVSAFAQPPNVNGQELLVVPVKQTNPQLGILTFGAQAQRF